MSSFAKAFNQTTNKTTTENGAVVESTTGNPVLDFSHKVVRSTSAEEIKNRTAEIINYVESNKDVNALHDFFVLMFHKRNPRGGEGEKAMTYQLVLNLYEYYPKTMVKLIHLLADFGYYKDFYQIWTVVSKLIDNETNSLTGTAKTNAVKFYYDKYNPLVQEIIQYTIQQRNSDLESLAREDNNISLIGKFLPSEGGSFNKHTYWFVPNVEGMLLKKSLVDMLVRHLAFQAGTKLNAEGKAPTYWYKKYRTGKSLLNKKLNIPEVAMCAGRYADLKFERIASRAMAKYRKAFMNEKLKETPKAFEESTGNRYPNNEDRVAARQNLKTLLESQKADKLKASTMEPHEIMLKLVKSDVSEMEKKVLTQMWESKKNDVRKHLSEMLETLKESGKDMGDTPRPGKIIPMVDVSESMTWDANPNPISVAISLGIMTAELHEDSSPFKDMLISFTDVPTNFKFTTPDLRERWNTVNRHKGYNTNFRLAMEELLKLCTTNGVKEEDIPDLLVFTDGQFDGWGPRQRTTSIQPSGHWETHHQELLKLWAAGGYSKVPRIIYWNLRGGTPGVQTDAHHPGVQMLQGFSPNLVKFVLYGESFENTYQEVVVDGKVVKMKVSSVTPWETFRGIIDQSRYDIVRIVLNDSDEKLLSQYHYAPVTDSDVPDNQETTTVEETPVMTESGFELI